MNQAIEKLLGIARAEIGVKESPAGSNKVKYNTWYYGKEVSGSSYAWCAVFVCWCFAQAGLRSLIKITGGCTTMMNWYKQNGQTIDPKSAQPGDLVFYQFDRDTYADHIGIVESVTRDGVVAIEGNTSLTSNDNGGAVMRRTRKWSQIMAVARPKWPEDESKEENGMTNEEIKALVRSEVTEAMKDVTATIAAAVKEAMPVEAVYHSAEEVPEWYRAEIKALVDKGALKGDSGGDLRLSEEMCRVLVVVSRMLAE